MQEFFYMGGYAFYVWTAYALTFIVLIINLITPIQRKRAILQKLARKLRRERHDHFDPQT